MKYKLLKVLAVLMILALFSAFALSEEAAEEINVGLDFESQEGGEGLEIDEQVIIETGSVEETPIEVDIDLSLETLETKSDATYRFIVNGEEYAVQTAQAGEKIEKPEDPAASEGKVFVGWSLVDGTPLFVDADGDGRIDPVIVSENEMDAEVYVWAEFAEEQPEEQSAEEPEQPAEESEQPTEEVPERPAEEPEQPAEKPEQPAEEEPEQPAEEEPEQPEPVANALTYTGEVQMLFNGEATWLYSLDGVTYSEEIPTAINAGEYTVYYKADEADEPQSITVTVAKADVEFTPPVAAIGEG